jgi:hypothetical protein
MPSSFLMATMAQAGPHFMVDNKNKVFDLLKAATKETYVVES